MELIKAADRALLFFLNGMGGASPAFDGGVIFLAEYLPYALVVLLALLLLSHISLRNTLQIGALALGAGLLARFGFGELIRFFYHRPRPFLAHQNIHTLFTEVSPAFPSGHALFFFALATVVYRYDKKWGALFFVAALLMGAARVTAGVHYPSDVLGGALIGITVGYLCARICGGFFTVGDSKKASAPAKHLT
ncbi:MAG: phosphoesterase PA-phosphatase-like protein [Parcubacteria group bacterium Gr01-1014_72]|nr:MAG: phosphoesterase PA-phosphatase-like protein [Parcubacteria group bacterium Gr01-1014_72]